MDALDFYTAALSVALLATLSLAAFGFARRSIPGAKAFVGLVLAGAAYALGSIFEIRSSNAAELGSWLAVEYLGIATIGPIWLVLALSLAGQRRPRSPFPTFLLFLVPAGVIAAVATNGLHRLFYSSLELGRSGPFTIPRLGKGPIYWANMAYMNLTILAGTVVALRRMVAAPPAYRRQAMIAFAACLIPWAGMAVYQSGLSPYGLDLAPFGIALSGMVYGWGLFRYRLFDLTPVVHENVFAGMSDGVMVFDLKRRLVGVNPAMAKILPALRPERIGERADELLEKAGSLLDLLDGNGSGCAEFHAAAGGQDGGARSGRACHYIAAASTLRDHKGTRNGTIITLSDISARVELLERIEAEREKSDRLLEALLPSAVAVELKESGAYEPRSFPAVSVLFSDLVDFTSRSARMEPKLLIEELNEMVAAFDAIMRRRGCERIKTIGDAYLAASGMPDPNPDHAFCLVNAAIEMRKWMEERNSRSVEPWSIRIGIHSGEAIAGIVGQRRYIYDVFGDTVNMASRMETASMPMEINISEVTWRLLGRKVACEPRGALPVKGAEAMNMYWVVARAPV
jgi:class 3 adenylate cyclase/PAS domain-containing protein